MRIALTGSIAYDYLMTFPGRFQEHFIADKLDHISLSFLVDNMTKRRGGVGPNIGYTMALLGGKPVLFGTVGQDFEEYRIWLKDKGVDTNGIKTIPDEFTASFFATTDLDNCQISSFYPGAMSHADEVKLTDWAGDTLDFIVISPTDPAAMKQYVKEAQDLNIPYLYDPSQQIVRLSGEELHQGVEGAYALFVNEYEFCLIEKHTGLTLDEIKDHLELLVITKGDQGSIVFTKDKEIEIPAVPPVKILDPTGIGDAFRGGFLTGFSFQLDVKLCGEMGALAAAYCLEADGPQSQFFTRREFIQRFRGHFDDQGKLDVLLEID